MGAGLQAGSKQAKHTKDAVSSQRMHELGHATDRQLGKNTKPSFSGGTNKQQ